MRSSFVASLLLFATLGACSGGDDPVPPPIAIDSLTVTVMGPTQAMLRWPATPAAGYIVQRRAGRTGSFQQVGQSLGPDATSFQDSLLSPEQTYGYRLQSVNGFGDVEGTSTVTGVTMPPIPGILVTTNSAPSRPADTSGYVVSVKGPADSVGGLIAPTGSRVFSPLRGGDYLVTLSGVSSNCKSADSLTRTVTVHELGSTTRDTAAFTLDCMDPTKGLVRAIVRTSGDTIDPSGFVLRLIGQASGVPDSEAAINPPPQTVTSDGGTFTFADIPPGRASLILEDVSPVCTVVPGTQQDFDVAALEVVERTFDVECTGSGGGGGSEPYVWRTTWSSATAPTGSAVALTLSLDLSQVPATYLSSFTVNVRTNAGVVRADSIRRIGSWDVFTANAQTQGEARISGVTTDQSKTGVVEIAKVWYTVVGATGTSLTPNTLLTTLSQRLASGADVSLVPDTRKVESKLTVGSGGGGNQPPVARPGGPYSGQPGAAIPFSGATSTDPDGTISSYAWNFGDGTTGTGASPTKSYAAAGTYTVSLTVTDNGGASSTATTTATISTGGGGSGFVFRPTWSVAQAPTGSKVSLTVALDLTSDPTVYLSAFTINLRTSSTVLRADSLRRLGTWDVFTSNIQTQGQARISGVTTDQSATGQVQLARIWYTVIGTTGATTTQSELTTLSQRLSNGTNESLVPETTTEEATFTVGTGGGGNQPPVARPGGPYSAVTGAAVPFNGGASSDPDGTIASYAWSFGDGSTGTGAQPVKSYSAAGTYTVSLTVTDNGGATSTATTTATITSSGGGNQSPVARPGGPYSGAPGSAIAFSGAASSDGDGTITSYAWSFGDGTTGTGVSPSKSYAAAGTYTVSLTVTDNLGATSTATTSATITAAPPAGLRWTSSFGAPESGGFVTLTVTMDMTSAPAGEGLAEWAVESLAWNPAVMTFSSFNWGSLGGGGSLDLSAAASGTIKFSATVAPAQQHGVVPIASIRFQLAGGAGATTTTQTVLSRLLGTLASNLLSQTTIEEGEFTVP